MGTTACKKRNSASSITRGAEAIPLPDPTELGNALGGGTLFRSGAEHFSLSAFLHSIRLNPGQSGLIRLKTRYEPS